MPLRQKLLLLFYLIFYLNFLHRNHQKSFTTNHISYLLQNGISQDEFIKPDIQEVMTLFSEEHTDVQKVLHFIYPLVNAIFLQLLATFEASSHLPLVKLISSQLVQYFHSNLGMSVLLVQKKSFKRLPVLVQLLLQWVWRLNLYSLAIGIMRFHLVFIYSSWFFETKIFKK